MRLARTAVHYLGVFALLATVHGACAQGMPPEAELQQVQQLVQRGAYAEAQVRIDAYLAQHPRDTRGRFLRGVALSGQDRADEAMSIYLALTQESPELPEPHNNLAALYAARGRYDEALYALQSALRAQPGFATAHENLGDLYAHFAVQSWARAAQLDRTRTTAQAKLKAVSELVPSAANPVNPR